MRILLVDPDFQSQQNLINVIKELEPSLLIEVARSAYDASTRLRFGRYDIIICEIFLPDLRGDLMMGFLKSEAFKIGITGYLTSPEIRRSFDDVLLKPVSEDELKLSIVNARMKSPMIGYC